MTQPLHDKLLACPFCGGEPKLLQDGYYEPANLDKYPERTRSWVVCPCDTHWKRNTAAEAITAWNTRAELTRNTAIVDKLAEAAGTLLARLDEMLPVAGHRPTIEELEKLLASTGGAVEIKPDGSIHTMPREEIEAFRQALATYRESVGK